MIAYAGGAIQCCFCSCALLLWLGMFASHMLVCDMSIAEHANVNKRGMTAPLLAGNGKSLECSVPLLDIANEPVSDAHGPTAPQLARRVSSLAVWMGEGKTEHCFIESVQFLLPAQGGGVLIWQPEEVQQEEEAEQERHPPGAARRGGDRQDECGELLVSHLLAQLLRLPPAEPATGLQALREHLPQRGEPELTQCRPQPWLSAHLHRAGPPAA